MMNKKMEPSKKKKMSMTSAKGKGKLPENKMPPGFMPKAKAKK